jgi:hypothetical protein
MPWPTDLKYSEIDGTLNHSSSKLLRSSRNVLLTLLRHQANFEWGGHRLYDGSHNHIHQNPDELTDFIFYLIDYEETAPEPLNNLLMLGFLDGATDTILNKVFCFEEIVAVDTFQEYGNGDFLRANLKYKNLTLICGDSTSKRVRRIVKSLGPYDLIFIDANHDYDFVKKDFENSLQMISSHGVIALHDVCAPSAPGVQKLWKEINESEKYHLESFYNSDVPMKTGIGVVRKKK